jgi:cell division septation protein DedD
MDRQLAERMVGAACLLAVLVLVVPSILDGNQEPGKYRSGARELLEVHLISARTRLVWTTKSRVPPVPQLREYAD